MKDHISNTKLEKGDDYYIQTQHNYLFFPLESYSKKMLRKNFPKGARTNNQTKCAHAAWASYDTPCFFQLNYFCGVPMESILTTSRHGC